MHGLPDRRKRQFRVKGVVGHVQLDLCQRFLQIRYHNEGEWLPDRFDFEGLGRPTLVYKEKGENRAGCEMALEMADSSDEDVSGGCQMSKDDWDEKDSRALASMAVKAIVTSNPFHNSMTGPGVDCAPRRYLGVVKPVILFQMCRRWCDEQNYPNGPSFTTFLRALNGSRKFIAFRKSSGQHGLCDECQYFKNNLRKQLSITERCHMMEDYAAHLLRNWRDRQVEHSWHAQAGETRQAMLNGIPLHSLQHSVLLLRSDGLDQAKHKIPRCQTFTKSFTQLVRPAMHVQMLWAHFHSVEFAISDPDIPKDSCSHMECLSRVFSGIYDQHQCLPRHLYLVLDNTARDNKNNFILRYFIKCRLLNVFESVYVCYPVKGHTHSCLDALGGQAVVKCSNCSFNTDLELISVYQQFLTDACFETGTFKTSCWKQDVSADWRSWVEDIPLNFSCLTGPAAPHGFRIVFRRQLEDIGDAKVTAWPGAPEPNADDLVMSVHKYMSDATPYQVCLLVPAREVEDLRKSCMTLEDREAIVSKAQACFEKGGISNDALQFLVGWAQGTKRREPRPPHYSFLQHRFDRGPQPAVAGRYLQHRHHQLRPVVVLQSDLSGPVPWIL